MAMSKGIAIIGVPTLAAVGIKTLILADHEIRVVSYVSFDDFRNFEESADGFIVTSGVFVNNLDYFIPRRQKTLLFYDEYTKSPASGDHLLLPFEDEAKIGEKLQGLVDSIIMDNEVPGELSAREKEVLRLLVAGKINKEIADELCISINTVITHRKNITAKTGIKSVSGLSIYALMNGIS